MNTRYLSRLTLLGLLLLLGACSSNPPEPPANVSFDGLEQVPGTGFAMVYKEPGADFSTYSEVALQPCEVSFRKNWLRDQNNSRMDLSNQVTKRDVEKIKATLGEMCDTTFRSALLQEPAYNVVDPLTSEGEVLLLAPAIINLDINAPDTMSPGRSRSYTTQSGEMTLLLELKDGTTGDVLARIVDRRKDFDDMQLQWTNSVTNRADAQRILNRWAKALRDGFDKVRTAS